MLKVKSAKWKAEQGEVEEDKYFHSSSSVFIISTRQHWSHFCRIKLLSFLWFPFAKFSSPSWPLDQLVINPAAERGAHNWDGGWMYGNALYLGLAGRWSLSCQLAESLAWQPQGAKPTSYTATGLQAYKVEAYKPTRAHHMPTGLHYLWYMTAAFRELPFSTWHSLRMPHPFVLNAHTKPL